MEVRHRETNLSVWLEAPRRCEHLDCDQCRQRVVTPIDGSGQRTLIPGGLKGYSEGNSSTPWYSPPAYGESGGPR